MITISSAFWNTFTAATKNTQWALHSPPLSLSHLEKHSFPLQTAITLPWKYDTYHGNVWHSCSKEKHSDSVSSHVCSGCEITGTLPHTSIDLRLRRRNTRQWWWVGACDLRDLNPDQRSHRPLLRPPSSHFTAILISNELQHMLQCRRCWKKQGFHYPQTSPGGAAGEPEQPSDGLCILGFSYERMNFNHSPHLHAVVFPLTSQHLVQASSASVLQLQMSLS